MFTFKKSRLVALATLVVAVVPAVALASGAGDPPNGHGAKAPMHDAQGNFLGTVWFLPRGHKVAVRATTSFLPEGFHGFHIHSVGACTPPFTSAGGHYNPAGVGHGRHAGDMPVLSVGKDGVAWAEFQTDAFTIDELVDADGSAVIVHAGSDNYANIPTRYTGTGPDAATLATGDAGTRIACGAVEAR